MAKIFMYFCTMIAVQIVTALIVGAVIGLIPGGSDMTAMQLILSSSISSVILIALFTLLKWTPFSRTFIQSRPWALLIWSMLIGFGMLIPTQFVEELIPDSLTQDILAEQMKMVFSNSWGYLAVGLLAPLVEEMVFRGAIQKAAIAYFDKKFANRQHPSPTTPWLGITLTAALFAAIHGNPAQMPHAFLVGLLLGWMCYRSGSIVPGIVVHWVNNTTAYIICAAWPETYDMTLSEFYGHSAMKMSLAIIFSLMIFIPAVIQFHLKCKGVKELRS